IAARRVGQPGRDGGAWLDATARGIEWGVEFPTVLAACQLHGIDPSREPVPVTPAAHFHMGGLATDELGRTSLPGLHAVGEVACSGVHGANRLASNSLLEGVVFGRRLGEHLASSRAADTDRDTDVAGEVLQVERGPGLDADRLHELRELMWHAAGPVRCADRLGEAISRVEALEHTGWQARLAGAILTAALHRSSSVGAHWRDDHLASTLASQAA